MVSFVNLVDAVSIVVKQIDNEYLTTATRDGVRHQMKPPQNADGIPPRNKWFLYSLFWRPKDESIRIAPIHNAYLHLGFCGI